MLTVTTPKPSTIKTCARKNSLYFIGLFHFGEPIVIRIVIGAAAISVQYLDVSS